MDKNTLIGWVLIGALLIGFTYISRPNKEQMAQMQQYQDSIQSALEKAQARQTDEATRRAASFVAQSDSAALFFPATSGQETFITLENEVVKLTLTNKGSLVTSAMLKEYAEVEKDPLVMFDEKETSTNFIFYNRREEFPTELYYFTLVNTSANSVTMRLVADSASYIDFTYALQPGSYLVDFTIQAHGMENKLSPSSQKLDIEWRQRVRQLEKSYTYENRYSNITYHYENGKTNNLSESGENSKSIEENLNWIAFKNRFFSSVLIADRDFEKTELASRVEPDNSGYVKDYRATMSTFFDPSGQEPTHMQYYFGPNHYKTLRAIDKSQGRDLDLDKLVYLGWPIVRWINKYFIINIFDWLSGLGFSMGMVLLFLTIIVKIVVFPATYKTFLSSARMRVLRPQIDEINKKYPKQEDAMKKQQETMALYSQYGVSPMGGCLPMLLQFPILMAMFMFVPTAIEFRQQSFLWADDLSTYDAFINLPFKVPFLGSHLSLFCLLMTVTTILNTKFTMQQQDTGQQQVPGMKWMMYLIPVMFLFILNEFPAGLNYYYLLSTLISVVTMIVLKKVTDDNKLLAQLEANKAKAKPKKQSGFAARLEAMQKEQERVMKERTAQQQKKKK
ncbi:MAG: membrane protein insertase YidC [Bacteroides sp.]|nr:membrane protein insertase YidC [Bacteroides sp.]